MINVDTLAVVLRALGRTPAPRTDGPPAVYKVPPASRIDIEQQLPATVEHAVNTSSTGNEEGVPALPSVGSSRVPSNMARTATASSTSSVPTPLATAMRGATALSSSPASSIALSPAGTLLLDAMNLPHQEQGPVIHVVQPLLSRPPQEPAELARAIEHAVTRSGVFYESHVARWAENAFPPAELAREPQAAWTAPSATAAAEHATSKGAAVPHPDAPALLRQQLEVHEAHRLVVMTDLWPGQRARLEFEEPGHTRDHGRDDAPEQFDRAWSTRVDLTLPSLGGVRAVISLCNGTVECRLSVDSRDAQARLGEARQDFDEALRRCSLALAHCSVSHER